MSPSTPDPFGQRPGLFDLPAIAVTVLTGEEFGVGLSRKALAKAADHLLRQIQRSEGLVNADTGWTLKINKNGRSKMGDNPELSATETKAVAGLVDLVWAAVLAETHEDSEHRNPQVQAVHRLFAPVEIGGVLYRTKLTAKTFVPALGSGRVLHAISAVEIENAPLGTLPVHETPKVPKPQAQPTTGRAISVRELMRGAQRQDGSAFV